MADRIFRIAIDGPSGAGKSTIAKAVARRLGIDYIDTQILNHQQLKKHLLRCPIL